MNNIAVPPPPAKRKSRLGASAPKASVAVDHLSEPSDSGKMQDMNFKVSPSFHKRFRVEASLRGMSMKELLEAMAKFYYEGHGGTLERPSPSLLDMIES